MTTRLAESSERVPTRLAYRPGLDGLRGLAVLMVVLYHLDVPGFRGGFIGVDVFFVLSGFLITSLLMKEHESGGRIDLVRFWARRARRLIPALIVVVVATMAAMPSISVFSTTGDGVASLLYAANWRFILTSQSYFADVGAASPFRHMWSLAVEEHFYLLWPLLFVVLWRLSRRRRLLWIGAVTAASALLMAVLYSPSSPSRAYFGTDARVHQILIGISVAVLLQYPAARMRAGRLWGLGGASALAGLVALGSDQHISYYLGGAVVVALAAGAVIVAVETAPGSAVPRAVAARPFIELGKRSYGIYLWHWPIIVWLQQRPGIGRGTLAILAIGATIGLAWLSFRYLELPIRQNHILKDSKTLLVAFAALGVTTATAVGLGSRYEAPAWMTADAENMVVAGFESFPKPVVGLIGDSVAASLVPGLEDAALHEGFAFVSVASRGCAVADGRQVEADGSPFTYTERCDELIPDGITEMLEQTRPDVVLWYSGRESNVHFEVDGQVLAPRTEQHDTYIGVELQNVVDLVTASGAELVMLEPFPVPGRGCTTDPTSEFCQAVDARQSTMDHLTRILGQLTGPGVQMINASRPVCLDSPECDPDMNGERVREDGNHFSERMARAVAPDLLSAALVGTTLERPKE